MNATLWVVAGAPGAGKSTVFAALLGLDGPWLAYDSDWLLEPASALAKRDLRTDATLWAAYDRLWLAIMRAGAANGLRPVLFAPWDLENLAQAGGDGATVRWLHLDCAASVRRERLLGRGWDEAAIAAALHDAATLRATIPTRLDSGAASAATLAKHIGAWVMAKIQP